MTCSDKCPMGRLKQKGRVCQFLEKTKDEKNCLFLEVKAFLESDEPHYAEEIVKESEIASAEQATSAPANMGTTIG